jgi:dihydroflavonol-4-reductase
MKLGYVTGATGCVGRNLVNELLKQNWDVVVLHRKSSDISRLRGCQVRFQEVNLHDLESVRSSIPENVDAIFHVAANISHWAAEADEQWKDNVLATRNLVQVALEKKVKRFIFTSTGATRFFQETDERRAKEIEIPYVRTKRLSELEVYAGLKKGLDTVILHPIIVMGAYDYNSYAQIFAFLKSSKLKIAFPGTITFCHAGDVAAAHVRAYEAGRRGERYVLGGPHAEWREACQKIADLVAAHSRVHAMPTWFFQILAYVSIFASSITRKKPAFTPELIKLVRDEPEIAFYDQRKAKEDLGYESRSLDTMIQDCYKWLTVEGRI